MNNNLNCDNVCDLMELYHDDLVRPATRQAVNNHLNECVSCRKEYEKIRGALPKIAEASTGKAFARLMKKKKTKQIVTTVICCLLACLILVSSYLVLTEVRIKTMDMEVHKVYRYTAPDNSEYFFVIYSYTDGCGSSPRIEVRREYPEGEEDYSDSTERVSILYERMIPIFHDRDIDGSYTDCLLLRIDELSTHKQGIISNLDCDELVVNGKVVWTKELNSDDEVPGFVEAYYDFEYSGNYNNDEFGNSDSMSIGSSVDEETSERHFHADYPDKTITWNLDGEIIEEKIKVPTSAESR